MNKVASEKVALEAELERLSWGARRIQCAPEGLAHDVAREVADGIQTSVADVASAAWPEELAPEAFWGPAGDIVRLIEPHTEADQAALLVQFLAAFGNGIGRGPYFQVESDRHYSNLFVALVGETSKGRKGSSWGRVRWIMARVDPKWASERVQSGLSSGEGLIWQVRDEMKKQLPIKEKGRVVDYEWVIEDPGVDDKRLFIIEAELGSTLRVMRREGNVLSPTMRQAWDTGDLRTLTKNSAARATGAHISVIGHITRRELLRHLDDTEAASGFANRYVWLCVRRSKCLPHGGRELDEMELTSYVDHLKQAATFAQSVQEMRLDPDARLIWESVYPELSEGKPGLLGAVISRAEAQTLRLACIYGLLDCSSTIRREHLLAALAVWDYSEASARFIFGDAVGDPIADSLLRALRTRAGGMTRTDIRDHFGRHRQKEKIDLTLALLQMMGWAYCVSEETGGRPLERWFATEATKATEGGLMSHRSLMSQPSYLAIAKGGVTGEGQPPWG